MFSWTTESLGAVRDQNGWPPIDVDLAEDVVIILNGVQAAVASAPSDLATPPAIAFNPMAYSRGY